MRLIPGTVPRTPSTVMKFRSAPFIADSVTGAQDGFAFTEPWNIPGQTDTWPKVVVIVSMYIGTDIRVRRIFSDELDLGKIRAARSRPGKPRRSGALHIQKRVFVADHPSR